MVPLGALAIPAQRTLPTTPMISPEILCPAVRQTRRVPIGSWPGKTSRAICSSIMNTRCVCSVSVAPGKRPRSSGIPIASK